MKVDLTARALGSMLALAMAAGCGSTPREELSPEPGREPAPTAPREPLVVGYSALRISLPIFVAEERGLFERHGVRVELRRYETAQPMVEELVDGRLDAAGYAAIPIVLTVTGHAGRSVRVATGMVEDEGHPVSVLLRRAGHSEIASIADLRGRRVGVLPTLAYTAWLGMILRGAGVEPSEVTVVPLAPALEVQALAEGGIDALFTGDPMATAAVASGAGERLGPPAPVPAALGGPHVFGTFLVGDEISRTRPREVAALLAALDEAIVLVNADPAGSREAMREHVREPERPHIALYPPALYLTSAELDDARFTAEAARAATLGLVATPPSVDGWSLASPTP